MAKRKSSKRRKKGSVFKRRLILLLLALFFIVLSWGYVNAGIVHVEYVNAYIDNLSPFLDGATILFASDFKITDQRSAMKAAKLMNGLMDMKPDLVILGGDYTHMPLSKIFSVQTEEGRNAMNEQLKQARMTFFSEIARMNPPGGVYAVAGDGDKDVPDLYSDCRLGNVTLIENGVCTASVKSFPITLVGYGDYLTGGSRSFKFKGPTAYDAVIALSHNPDAYALISSVMDESGNPVADLVLSGHSLGGQINLFGKSIMEFFGGYSGEFMGGSYNETGPDMLVSGGVGCDWLPLRFGSRSEVSFITLKRK